MSSSVLAKDLLEAVTLSKALSGKLKIDGKPMTKKEQEQFQLNLIDQKLSGVRISVEQAYVETLSTIHEEAWNSVRIDNEPETEEQVDAEFLLGIMGID